MYVNGILEASLPSTGNVGNSTGAMFFGLDADRYPNSNLTLNGKLDDIRIYNRALSAEDVTELYQSEIIIIGDFIFLTTRVRFMSWIPIRNRKNLLDPLGL